jgi:uncharacterized protein (DUF305 family)
MKKTSATFLGLSLALAGGLAFAQETMEGMDHSNMDMSGGDTVTMSNGMEMAAMAPMTDEGMRPFMVPMDTMMANMPMTSSGMPDADFLLMMIPHHQSAIDMAEVQLEMGTDEETRAMAQEIIDAQEAEIAEMRAMLERMGVEPPAAPAE